MRPFILPAVTAMTSPISSSAMPTSAVSAATTVPLTPTVSSANTNTAFAAAAVTSALRVSAIAMVVVVVVAVAPAETATDEDAPVSGAVSIGVGCRVTRFRRLIAVIRRDHAPREACGQHNCRN